MTPVPSGLHSNTSAPPVASPNASSGPSALPVDAPDAPIIPCGYGRTPSIRSARPSLMRPVDTSCSSAAPCVARPPRVAASTSVASSSKAPMRSPAGWARAVDPARAATAEAAGSGNSSGGRGGDDSSGGTADDGTSPDGSADDGELDARSAPTARRAATSPARGRPRSTIDVSWVPQGLMGVILAPGTGNIPGMDQESERSVTRTTRPTPPCLPPGSHLPARRLARRDSPPPLPPRLIAATLPPSSSPWRPGRLAPARDLRDDRYRGPIGLDAAQSPAMASWPATADRRRHRHGQQTPASP